MQWGPHRLGDDRAGLRFAIVPDRHHVARIEWKRRDESLTYAEATGRERSGRGIRDLSQSCRVEAWLREYLSDGEKLSVEIFHEALERGFTEHRVRGALRRVADKSKQGFQGQWIWRLHGT